MNHQSPKNLRCAGRSGELRPSQTGHAARLRRHRTGAPNHRAGTMVLERFHQPVQVVRQDGFRVDGEIYMELEGSTPATMAKSVGFGMVEFASEFQRLKPDVVLLIGDRYEALAAAVAAAYMNICIVHIQGGEVSAPSTKARAMRSRNSPTFISRARIDRRSILFAWVRTRRRSWESAAPAAISPARSIARFHPEVVNGRSAVAHD